MRQHWSWQIATQNHQASEKKIAFIIIHRELDDNVVVLFGTLKVHSLHESLMSQTSWYNNSVNGAEKSADLDDALFERKLLNIANQLKAILCTYVRPPELQLLSVACTQKAILNRSRRLLLRLNINHLDSTTQHQPISACKNRGTDLCVPKK